MYGTTGITPDKAVHITLTEREALYLKALVQWQLLGAPGTEPKDLFEFRKDLWDFLSDSGVKELDTGAWTPE